MVHVILTIVYAEIFAGFLLAFNKKHTGFGAFFGIDLILFQVLGTASAASSKSLDSAIGCFFRYRVCIFRT